MVVWPDAMFQQIKQKSPQQSKVSFAVKRSLRMKLQVSGHVAFVC